MSAISSMLSMSFNRFAKNADVFSLAKMTELDMLSYSGPGMIQLRGKNCARKFKIYARKQRIVHSANATMAQ